MKRVTGAAAGFCLLGMVLFAAVSPAAEDKESSEGAAGRKDNDTEYRTPRAGEGLRAEVFGRPVEVHPRNRRLNSSWYAGFDYAAGLDDNEVEAFAFLYYWNHPDDEHLQRALISLIYNEFLWARKAGRRPGLEFIFTFQSYTRPRAEAVFLDGQSLDEQELRWGYVRLGAGVGYREQVAPGNQDNMISLDFLLEPAYFYFSRGPETATNFTVPRDTPELRAHLQMRWDAIERNLLELPHQGVGAGGDLVAGFRSEWQDWGMNGEVRQGREFNYASAYVFAAGRLPGLDSDRHHLLGSLHGGWGRHLDRFSAKRLGGGPNTIGEEFLSTADPVLPGAAMGEFFPQHYLVAFGEYRWEPAFFAYLGFNASVARVDRMRDAGTDIVNRTDTLTSAGIRLATGFLFNSRLQMAYNYGFFVVRKGEYGAHEFVMHLSKTF